MIQPLLPVGLFCFVSPAPFKNNFLFFKNNGYETRAQIYYQNIFYVIQLKFGSDHALLTRKPLISGREAFF